MENERKDDFYHRHEEANRLMEAKLAAYRRCRKCANYSYCGIDRGVGNCGAFTPKTIENK